MHRILNTTKKALVDMKSILKQYKYFFIGCLSVVVFFLSWYIFVDVLDMSKNSSFPTLERMCKSFLRKLVEKKPDGATLGQHLFESLKVCLLGYGLGVITGVPVGIAMAWNKWCDRLVRPVFDLIRPIPGLAWTPMFILLFGIGISAKAMVIFINSFIACILNSYTGIRQTNELHLWVGDVFGASSMQKLFRIAIPTAIPMIFTGLRTALGGSWMALVAAEMLASSKGLGYMIQQARYISRPDLVIIGMLTIGFVGMILDVILREIELAVAKGMNAR
jgi:ABC-type nitrate/sulfonate/bicarbonate transport system permease component